MQIKDNKKKYFFLVTAMALIFSIIYVPYIKYDLILIGGQTTEIIQETGFMFVGDLPFMAKINTSMLFIEIIVILSIAFGFYFFVLREKN